VGQVKAVKVCQGKAVEAGRGMERLGMAVGAGSGSARRGPVGQGGLGLVCCGQAGSDVVWHGGRGLVWRVDVRFGEAVEARRGEVWSGGRGWVW